MVPVTIKTPHYYKQCLDSDDGSIDTTIFDRITEDSILFVRKTVRDHGTEVRYEVERDTQPNFSNCKAYLADSKYVSNKQEFEEAYLAMKQFIEQEVV